jgi:hypothetical protein
MSLMNVIYNNELPIFFFVLRMFKLLSKFTRFIYLKNIKFIDELHEIKNMKIIIIIF